MNQGTGEIICTAHGQGKMHDFRLFKHSRIPLKQTIKCLVDKGYQGIQKFHVLSQVPQKKPRKGTLSDEARKEKSGVSETTSNWRTCSSKTENF